MKETKVMIAELLELRNILTDIASELYGELYVTNDSFWDSPTEQQMAEVEEKLVDLGHTTDITPEQLEAARKIAKEMGMDDLFEEDEI
tara:strand:+ start:618 stop:881 length:264 start_codon:yes stop_codon:yes gene_type:complete